MEQLYISLLKEKNLKNLPYSHDYLTNPAYQTPNKAVVLAAGTGGGKTIISILWSMMYYQNPLNKGNLTLILPASKTILRENYSTELAKLNPSFSWREVKDKAQLIEAINDGVEVIIGLPQTIMKNYTLLPKVDRFILDEAHEWYFAKGKNGNEGSIQKLIKHINPTEQLLLTGTPSKFVAKGNDFIFKFVPILELYELGQVGNVKLEVVSSSYDFKSDDWHGVYGNLRGNKTNSKKEAEHSLKLVCNEMLNKLKNKYKNLHSLNNITGNKIGWLFNYLEKTTIYTHSKKQANAFYTILNEIPELKDKIRKSHSENDPTSKEFKEFKDGVDEFGNQVDIKILIAVDRGRIGFNMPELFHIIDFTMTQNLDMLLQMYGRLLRVSDLNPNKQKIYFKVATKNTADYFVDLMTAMLCLTNMEWYSKYNGKNMGGIRIPKVLTKKRNKPSKSSGKSTSTSKPYISLEELGIPLDLNFFKNSILHSSNDLFSTIAWTTLDDVRREFFNIQPPTHNGTKKDFLPSDEAISFVNGLKLKSLVEWIEFTKSDEMPDNIPVGFQYYYNKTEGRDISVAEWIGYLNPMSPSKSFVSFIECKKWFSENKITTQNKWREWCKNNSKPQYIPSSPDKYYKKEWKGWGDFTDSGNMNIGVYRPFNEAREYIRSLKFKTRSNYADWIKSGARPDDIPSDASKCTQYKTEWKGWDDYLGCKIVNTIDMKVSDIEKVKICNLYKKLLREDKNHRGICVKIKNEFYNTDSITLNQIRKCVKELQPKVRTSSYTKADIPELKRKLKKVKGMKEARATIGGTAYNFLKELGIIKKLFPHRIVGNQFGLKIVK